MLVDAGRLTWAGVVFLGLVFFFGSIVLIRDSRTSPPSWWCLGKCQSGNVISHRVAEWATLSHALLMWFALDEHFLNCGPRDTLLLSEKEFFAELSLRKAAYFKSHLESSLKLAAYISISVALRSWASPETSWTLFNPVLVYLFAHGTLLVRYTY